MAGAAFGAQRAGSDDCPLGTSSIGLVTDLCARKGGPAPKPRLSAPIFGRTSAWTRFVSLPTGRHSVERATCVPTPSPSHHICEFSPAAGGGDIGAPAPNPQRHPCLGGRCCCRVDPRSQETDSVHQDVDMGVAAQEAETMRMPMRVLGQALPSSTWSSSTVSSSVSSRRPCRSRCRRPSRCGRRRCRSMSWLSSSLSSSPCLFSPHRPWDRRCPCGRGNPWDRAAHGTSWSPWDYRSRWPMGSPHIWVAEAHGCAARSPQPKASPPQLMLSPQLVDSPWSTWAAERGGLFPFEPAYVALRHPTNAVGPPRFGFSIARVPRCRRFVANRPRSTQAGPGSYECAATASVGSLSCAEVSISLDHEEQTQQDPSRLARMLGCEGTKRHGRPRMP